MCHSTPMKELTSGASYFQQSLSLILIFFCIADNFFSPKIVLSTLLIFTSVELHTELEYCTGLLLHIHLPSHSHFLMDSGQQFGTKSFSLLISLWPFYTFFICSASFIVKLLFFLKWLITYSSKYNSSSSKISITVHNDFPLLYISHIYFSGIANRNMHSK